MNQEAQDEQCFIDAVHRVVGEKVNLNVNMNIFLNGPLLEFMEQIFKGKLVKSVQLVLQLHNRLRTSNRDGLSGDSGIQQKG